MSIPSSASPEGLPAPARPIHALTGLRFVAALLVFLHHAAPSCFYEGFSGVTFFFVLSGFILTYNYQRTFTRLQCGQLWSFYVCRAARIYPVHLLTFVAITPLYWSHIGLHRSQIIGVVKNLTLTQSFGRSYFSFNAVAWSLSDEIFFYSLLPVVLWGLWKLRLNRAVPTLLSIGAIWFAAFSYVTSQHDDPLLHWRCYVNPVLRFGDFLIGVLLGKLYARMQGTVSAFGKRPTAVFTVLEVLAVASFLIAWECSRWVTVTTRLGPYYTPSMASIVFLFAFESGVLSRAIGTWLGRWLGEISFSFYMIHQMILLYLDKYKESLHLAQTSDRTVGIIAFLASVFLAGACYACYEDPMRRKWRLYLMPRERAARSEAQAEAPSLARAA
jgi:peptidoglycan/LPS O-acetylase OafA/YrhL